MGIFDKFSDQLSDVGKNISSSTQQFVNEQKIQASIRDKKNTINEALLNLGKAYYTAHADDKDSEFAGTIAAIKSEYMAINDLKKQISDIRGKTICPKCGAEIDKDAAFCPKCGAKIAEPEKTAEAPKEEAPAEEPAAETESQTASEEPHEDSAEKTE